MTMLRTTMLSLVLLAGVAGAAYAGSPDRPDPDEMAMHLNEKLGVATDAAARIAETVQQAHEEGELIGEEMRTQVEALKSALDAGDEAGMASALTEVRTLRVEVDALKERTQAAVLAEMTVEQQAKLTLHQLHKRHRAEKVMRALD